MHKNYHKEFLLSVAMAFPTGILIMGQPNRQNITIQMCFQASSAKN